MTSNPIMTALTQAGVSIWLDDLSRELITSGTLADLIRGYAVTGVTSNPTIFAAALSHGAGYEEQVGELAARNARAEDAVRELTVTDVQHAADLLRDIHDTTGGVDGRVSLEVDPRLAHDTERTVAEAIDLWKAVDRPNLMVKIPATTAGLPAITRVLAEGISVNVTLIFSVQRYRAVIDAYLTGLEQAHDRGHNIGQIASVASFFVSRVDAEIDTRLDGIDGGRRLRGQAAIANARLAYAAHQEEFATDRWRVLELAGAVPQRPLWASTGVKDPACSDTRYVEQLVAPNSVNTMPAATLAATADHAAVHGDTVTGTAAAARQVFDDLTAAGIDLDDIFAVLEQQGVEKFQRSWDELLDTVRAQLAQQTDAR